MIDYPEEMHDLFNFITNDILDFAKWQEDQGLLTLNNGNDYIGSGSCGFTNELPTENYEETGIVTMKDIWVNMNSQETVGISPDMFGEFIFPYYYEIAKEFGMVYFGCCEPIHMIWEKYISRLPGLRKVSISAWSNEEYMGDVLRGSNVIYSRKPSPNYIGVGSELDEPLFKEHILSTIKAAEGCKLEFVFRDIYTLSGNIRKPCRAVEIIREIINDKW